MDLVMLILKLEVLLHRKPYQVQEQVLMTCTRFKVRCRFRCAAGAQADSSLNIQPKQAPQ